MTTRGALCEIADQDAAAKRAFRVAVRWSNGASKRAIKASMPTHDHDPTVTRRAAEYAG